MQTAHHSYVIYIVFQISIAQNSYDDILFYEKKALNLERFTEYLNQAGFHIDMQMNLAEYLLKISPANIYDQDLISKDDADRE